MAKLPRGFATYMPRYIQKITMQFWSTEEHLNIRLFARWWEAKNRIDPRRYPLQLPDGGWDERYHAWCKDQAAQKAQTKKRPLEKASAFNKAIAQEVALESGSSDTETGPEGPESRKARQA